MLLVAFTSGDMLAAISKRAGAARSSEQVLGGRGVVGGARECE